MISANSIQKNADLSESANDQERMRTLIETLSSYIEHYHGGAVEMVDFDGSELRVKLLGACDGCDLAPVTLHGWVEGTVKQFFPNLEQVISI